MDPQDDEDLSDNSLASDTNGAGLGQPDDEIASKLSKELSNWRRRRGAPKLRAHGGNSNSQHAASSEPARTIKVRGHETLVIRKSRVTVKPRPDGAPEHE